MNDAEPEKNRGNEFERGLLDNANPKFTDSMTPKGNKYLAHLPISIFIAFLVVSVIYLIPAILNIEFHPVLSGLIFLITLGITYFFMMKNN